MVIKSKYLKKEDYKKHRDVQMVKAKSKLHKKTRETKGWLVDSECEEELRKRSELRLEMIRRED